MADTDRTGAEAPSSSALRAVVREEISGWPGSAAVGVVDGAGLHVLVDEDRVERWASVTKVLTALTVLVLVDEGWLDLDDPAGPEGSTVRHLLAHASGVAVDSEERFARPGTRRIYSNRGYELLAERVQDVTGERFATLLRDRVLQPLGMTGTTLEGSPASGAVGPLRDLATLAVELVRPTRLPSGTVERAREPAFPGLDGVLPGFGRQSPNDWGLGPEIRGRKDPHWTSPRADPRTFGHFGQSGSFVWVDPSVGVAGVALSSVAFGPWAVEAWPRLNDRVLRAVRAARPRA